MQIVFQVVGDGFGHFSEIFWGKSLAWKLKRLRILEPDHQRAWIVPAFAFLNTPCGPFLNQFLIGSHLGSETSGGPSVLSEDVA